MLWHNPSLAQLCLLIGTVSWVSDVSYGLLVYNKIKMQTLILCTIQ